VERLNGCRYGVTPYIEKKIRMQATGFAERAKVPHAAEDLAQEARVEAWQDAEAGETNTRHILADTRERIRDVAKKGKSVDGRIYHTWNRDHVYDLLSTERPLRGGTDPVGELLVDGKQRVEAQVWASILTGELEELLTAEEWRLFEARTAGYTYTDVWRNDPLMTEWEAKQTIRTMKEKIAGYLGWDDADEEG
jgi:hypothetical protein